MSNVLVMFCFSSWSVERSRNAMQKIKVVVRRCCPSMITCRLANEPCPSHLYTRVPKKCCCLSFCIGSCSEWTNLMTSSKKRFICSLPHEYARWYGGMKNEVLLRLRASKIDELEVFIGWSICLRKVDCIVKALHESGRDAQWRALLSVLLVAWVA